MRAVCIGLPCSGAPWGTRTTILTTSRSLWRRACRSRAGVCVISGQSLQRFGGAMRVWSPAAPHDQCPRRYIPTKSFAEHPADSDRRSRWGAAYMCVRTPSLRCESAPIQSPRCISALERRRNARSDLDRLILATRCDDRIPSVHTGTRCDQVLGTYTARGFRASMVPSRMDGRPPEVRAGTREFRSLQAVRYASARCARCPIRQHTPAMNALSPIHRCHRYGR